MAYDFSGSWTPLTAHHAQFFNAHDSNNTESSGRNAVYYTREHGFPSQKILLGIPVYGRSFLNVENVSPRQGITGYLHKSYRGAGGEDGTFEYKDLPRPGTVEMVDMGAVAAYCVGGDGGFVSYDNPDTVRAKGEWARVENLGVSDSFLFIPVNKELG